MNEQTILQATFEEATIGILVVNDAGEIVKVICEPYEYENKTTGEIMQLQHSYAYQAEGAMEAVGHTRISQLELA